MFGKQGYWQCKTTERGTSGLNCWFESTYSTTIKQKQRGLLNVIEQITGLEKATQSLEAEKQMVSGNWPNRPEKSEFQARTGER